MTRQVVVTHVSLAEKPSPSAQSGPCFTFEVIDEYEEELLGKAEDCFAIALDPSDKK
jgi:hypothetical protein